MKKFNSHLTRLLLSGVLLGATVAAGGRASAQENATSASVSTGMVKGKVVDENGKPVPFATVNLKGTSMGANTDDDGAFSLKLPDNVTSGTLVISSIGFTTKEIAFDGTKDVFATLPSGSKNLNEVVVIGYGTAKQKDLTGSIVTVNSDEFNQGAIATPDQLIQGKAAGVVVTPNGGAPGAGSTIRIRGINSISAGQSPLIVLDGVPLSDNSIGGAPDPLSTINPDDIESFTILKDAASAAIYGNRASGGVIEIVTKQGKGGGKLRVNFNSTTGVSQVTGYTKVLTGDQIRALIASNPTGLSPSSLASQVALLGKSNTDWQKQIYQNALSNSNNISFTGGIKGLPYRLSIGTYDQQGVLQTGYLKRESVGLNLSPKFLNNSLKVTVNVNASHSESRFANTAAIGDAIKMDPTQAVKSGDNAFGGYFTWLANNNVGPAPQPLAEGNPVADLNYKRDISAVNRAIGNVQVEYALPSFPELKAVVNAGGDIASSNGYVSCPAAFAGNYISGGSYNTYKQYNSNKVLDFYLNYKKEFTNIHSLVDLTGGYSFQDVLRGAPAVTTYYTIAPSTISAADSFETALLSYYARLNYTFHDKYLLTASIREDGSSKFSSDNRWGVFPAVAVAWKINQENFLKNSKTISQLKLRASYGVTGNQSGIGAYDYVPNYTMGSASGTNTAAQYPLGNTYYTTLVANGYNNNLKWETTAGTNIALDYGFFNGRLTGSIDFYSKKTDNLLISAPVPAGANLTNEITQNVASMTNKGVEFSVEAVPVSTKDFKWSLGFNIAYNKNNVTKLYGDSVSYITTGGISGGTGNNIQRIEAGQPLFSYYVQQQVYNSNGRPIEGLYTTQSDGTNSHFYKSALPTTTVGFTTQFTYKKWGLFMAMHGSFGNYMYNNVTSILGNTASVINSIGFIGNASPDIYNTKFNNPQYFSDYYIQNASFLRMDNIALSYNFGRIIDKKVGLKISAICQNVFVIRKYPGLNPEVNGGIDINVYPKPRIYSLAVNLNF